MSDLQWVLEGMEYFFKVFEDIIFSYKAIILPSSAFRFLSLSSLQPLSPPSERCVAPSKEHCQRKKHLLQNQVLLQGGFIKVLFPPENNHKGFLLLFFSLLFNWKSIKMEIECEKKKRNFFGSKLKIPAEQLQYCNYHNLRLSSV